MDKAGGYVVEVLTAIISVAILAVVVSKQSDTSNVIKSFADGFSSILKVAVSPVTSGSSTASSISSAASALLSSNPFAG